MRLVIVTGMSGAGKASGPENLWRDLGFYCVDNLPIPLMEAFVELVVQKPAAHEEVAGIWNVISGAERSFPPNLEQVLENWKAQQVPMKSCFSTAVAPSRSSVIKETRRSSSPCGKRPGGQRHPVWAGKLAFIKQQANVIPGYRQPSYQGSCARSWRKSLSRTGGIRICSSRCCLLVLNMGFPMTRIWCLTCVSAESLLVEALRSHTGQGGGGPGLCAPGRHGRQIPLLCFTRSLDFLISNYVQEGKPTRLPLAVPAGNTALSLWRMRCVPTFKRA